MVDKSVEWLERRIMEEVDKGISQFNVLEFIYGCYALHSYSRDLAPLMFFIDTLDRNYSLWIYVTLDLPLKDPQAFLYFHELMMDVNPNLAKKLNNIGNDISIIMLPDGRFPGVHEKLLYLVLKLYGLEDVRFKSAVKYFREKISKLEVVDIEEGLWTLKVSSMFNDLILPRFEIAGMIMEKQEEDGSWGKSVSLTISVLEGLMEAGINPNHPSISKALNWIQGRRLENNSWEDSILSTSRMLILYRRMPTTMGFQRVNVLTPSTTPSLMDYVSETMLKVGCELIMENPPLTEGFKSIVKALRRVGVEVKILLDPLFVNVNPNMEGYVNYLKNLGVNVRFSELAKTSMLIADGGRLLLLPNVPREDMVKNGVIGIAIEDPKNVENARKEFLKVWENAKEELSIPDWIKRARTTKSFSLA